MLVTAGVGTTVRQAVRMIDGIELREFQSPASIAALAEDKCSGLPAEPGVYIVLCRSSAALSFLDESSAGWYKGQDPSYPPGTAQAQWVSQTRVVYVGMTRCPKGLRSRIRALVYFACGKPVGHRGGRLLWHLADWRSLEVLWLPTPMQDANPFESQLIAAFRDVYGVRPFVNTTKELR